MIGYGISIVFSHRSSDLWGRFAANIICYNLRQVNDRNRRKCWYFVRSFIPEPRYEFFRLTSERGSSRGVEVRLRLPLSY